MNRILKWKYLPHLLLAFLVAEIYSCSITYPLLAGWDDHIYVSGNIEKLQMSAGNVVYWMTHACEGCYLPLTMFSYMVDYAVWGLNGFGYHLQNIFWHVLAVVAVFCIMRRFGTAIWLAFGLALAFGIHPQRVESVVWISERKDVMCAAFYFWSLYFWLTEKTGAFPLKSLVLFVLAIFSKSMAVSLPLIFIVCEYYAENKFNFKAWAKKLWPFLLIAMALVPVTILSQDINREGISIPRQVYVLAHNIAWYIRTTFVSGWLSPIYPRVTMSILELSTMIATYLVIAGAVFAFYRGNRTYFMNGIIPLAMCFLFSLAPVAGFLPLGAIDYADRYSYIPSAFLWIILGGLMTMSFTRIPPSGKGLRHYINIKLMTYGGIIYVVILALMNISYSGMWRDYHSVLSAACMYEPPSYMALGALGDLELSMGNYEEAVKISDRILSREKGLETEKGYGKIVLKAKYTRAFALYNLGNKREALSILEEIKSKLGVDSFGTPEGYNSMIMMMINCCNSLGEKEKAEKLSKEILR